MEDKNFGLTEATFQNMVNDLKSGKEELFEHIFLSQFEKSIAFIKGRYKMTQGQAYDACMDSLIEFRRCLLLDKIAYGNLNYLFTKMASQRFFKNVKKDNAYDEMPENMEIVDDEMILYSDEKIILEKAWARLGQNCQDLLKKYYYLNIKLKILAEQDSKKPESIRKQKQRCLNTLRINFQSLMKP